MAWYHTNSCSCPEGCCDCGSKPYEDEIALWYDAEEDKLFLSSHLPRAYYMKDEWFHKYISEGKWTLISIERPELLNNEQKAAIFTHSLVYGEIAINRSAYENVTS